MNLPEAAGNETECSIRAERIRIDMKTLEQLYEELNRSEECRAELAGLLAKKDRAALADWLKKQGCEASVDEAKQYLTGKKTGELSPEELEQASGGMFGLYMQTEGDIYDAISELFCG